MLFSAGAVLGVVDMPDLSAFWAAGDGKKERSDAATVRTPTIDAAKWKKVGEKGVWKEIAKDAGDLRRLEPGQRNSLSSAHADGPSIIDQRDRHKTSSTPRFGAHGRRQRSCQPRAGRAAGPFIDAAICRRPVAWGVGEKPKRAAADWDFGCLTGRRPQARASATCHPFLGGLISRDRAHDRLFVARR